MCVKLRTKGYGTHRCWRSKHEEATVNGAKYPVHRCWWCGYQWVDLGDSYVVVGDARSIRTP